MQEIFNKFLFPDFIKAKRADQQASKVKSTGPPIAAADLVIPGNYYKMKIGLISDTHGYLDEQVFKYFQDCDEIWHAGDIGTLELISQLENFKPVRAVWGNIDGKEIRAYYPENQVFECEGKKIWITHIGGKPPLYSKGIKPKLKELQPDLFICGHSHILRVITDDKMGNLLYVNPGAAGLQGFHKIRTLLRFEINSGKISNMQVVELGKRGQP